MGKEGVTVISCRRGAAREKCRCGSAVTIRCDFPLIGMKTGETCDRGLCAKCAVKVGEKQQHYCGAHYRVSLKAGTLPRRAR